ncbi:MAG: thioredoxin [Thermoprotei archaeon]
MPDRKTGSTERGPSGLGGADGVPVHLSEKDFDEFIKKHRLCIVDFWAEWCAPCRFLEPIVEELAGEYQGRVAFGKLNVDDNPSVVERYEIMSIPTLLVFKEGKPIQSIVGAMPKAELVAQIEPLLA